MASFFLYADELPAGSGFSVFGVPHLLWLLVLTAAGAAVRIRYRRAEYEERKTAVRIVGAAALLVRWMMVLYLLIRGFYGIGWLPLHVCGMAGYFCAVHAFLLPGRERADAVRSPYLRALSEVLFFPVLPGAVCALLFPGWAEYPAFSCLSICEFLGHGLLVLYVSLRLSDGTIRPEFPHFGASAAFLFIYAAVMIPVDRKTGLNYGFLNAPSPDSPLSGIAAVTGNGIGYYIGYALFVLTLMLFCYGLAHFFAQMKRQKYGTDL